MDIEKLPGIPSNGEWVLKGQNGLPYWRDADVDFSDKYLSSQGENNGIPGQYAVGYVSKTRWNKKNPPCIEDCTDPIRFTAVGTYEGVTETYEDIVGIIIDKANGASASVTYGGKVFDIPEAPEDSELFQTGFLVFPEVSDAEEFDLPQVAPLPGMEFMNNTFRIISVEKVEGGWGVIFGSINDLSEEGFPSLYPDFDEDLFTGIVMLDLTSVEDWQDEVGTAYAFGNRSYAFGANSIASGYCSVASGSNSIASGAYSNADGVYSVASGDCSTASGNCSVASGADSVASGVYSVASGDHSTASGNCSVASGAYSNASGSNSVASGAYSTASGTNSIAIGNHSTASGTNSIASGSNTLAQHNDSVVFGKYNVEDSSKMLILGNGFTDSNRKNIFTVDYNGKPDSARIPSVNGGDMVVIGTAAPTTKPAFAGQIYLDKTNKKLYVAKDATFTTDWVAIN